jgi:exonuclease III
MNLISWNCRGLGNPRAIRSLCRLVREKKPNILFLMETKCRKEKMEVLRVRMEFEGMFVVDVVGRSGGLALFWKERNVVKIQNYTRKHISAVVHFPDRSKSWRLTGFYGNPDWTKRYESWTLLRHLKLYEPDAWLCIGDFNEIIDQNEKWGGVFRSENQMMQFRLALKECGLSDLGFRGSKFTWTNRRHDGDLIKERLDRAVANEAWCRLQTMREVQVLAGFKSDHLPLCVQLGDGDTSRRVMKKKFKIEASWMHDDDYLGVVHDAWTEVDSFDHRGDLLQQKLNRCQTKLKSWSFRKFGNDEKELKEKTKRLEELQQEEGAENWEEVLQIQEEIDAILEREDTKWKQRSKQNWYQNGDRNTSFFHAWADHRRRINQI